MKRLTLIALTVGAALLATVVAPAIALADLRVVATLPALGALAEEVGGDAVAVEVLASASQDPHFVDARPNFVVALNRADLVVANGMDLEIGWLFALLAQARNPDVLEGRDGYFDASTAITPLGVPGAGADRSQGDVHAAGNPHYLYDARRAALVARALGERMAALDPGNAAGYRARGEAVAAAIDAWAGQAGDRFGSLGATDIVTYHASMLYLEDWLGLDLVATVEPRPGVPPSPSHTASVVQAMRSQGVGLVLQETYYPTNTSTTLGQLTGATLVTVTGGPADGQTWLDWSESLLDEVYDALAH